MFPASPQFDVDHDAEGLVPQAIRMGSPPSTNRPGAAQLDEAAYSIDSGITNDCR
jgi:hypothetical protein